MIQINSIHHLAIICSDYAMSRKFYTEVLGFKVMQEIYREERQSYKTDLSLNDHYIIELFSFPSPPARPSRPEATGLRHLAFEVNDIAGTIHQLKEMQIVCEPIRTDEFTGKKFTFTFDPDNLPIEFYER